MSIPQLKDQQLFERAQFSPAEVSHLKTQFEQLDFVSIALPRQITPFVPCSDLTPIVVSRPPLLPRL